MKNFCKLLAVLFVLALAACGSSGGGDDAAATARIVMDSSLADGEQLPQNNTATITATVFTKEGDRVLDGTRIKFTASTGRIAESVATVGGVATVQYFAPAAGGVVTITAEYSRILDVVSASSAINLMVAASPDTVSLETSLPPGDDLAQGGTTTITAMVIGDDGTLIADGTEVLFTATAGNITAVAETVLGEATASYTAPSFGGVVTITASADLAVDNIDLTIASGEAAFIEIDSITPTRLGLAGTGVDNIGTFIFNVKDSIGNPVADNTVVNFDLYTETGGGEDLSATSNVTVDGVVSVSLVSGTVPGVATVTASVGSATTEAKIPMGYGKTDQEHISISFDPLNIAGMRYNGLETAITAYVGDRFSNPVPAGTPVYFGTSCGLIGLPTSGIFTTDDYGKAQANWITANPTPPESNTLCTTIMWTEGEEAYDDLNANGMYDRGEPHEDIGDPYVDANQNGEHDEGELFYSDSDVYSSGNGEWDGDTMVWTESNNVTRWSDYTASPEISPETFNIPSGGSVLFTIVAADVNGGPLPAESTVKVTTDCDNSSLTGDTDVTIRDAVYSGPGTTEFYVTLSSTDDVAGDPASCALTVDVSADPNGDSSRTINGTMD